MNIKIKTPANLTGVFILHELALPKNIIVNGQSQIQNSLQPPPLNNELKILWCCGGFTNDHDVLVTAT